MSANAKKPNTQTKKGRIKTLNLKREYVKVLSGREQKKIKGGGGAKASVDLNM